MATFSTLSFKHGGDMPEVIADQNYYYDAQGNVTTDESKGERWLAREGANVLPEHREALKTFQGTATSGKVARQEATADESTDEGADEKAAAKPANKKASPSKNKGAK